MLLKRSKNVFSSLKELESDAFDVVNYAAASATTGQPENLTIASTTKTGVLGGSVAAYKGSYLVGQGTHLLVPLGLFVQDAQPDNFVNAPAIASNKLPITQFGGEVEVDVFETHAWADLTSLIADYSAGVALYCSSAGLLTTEVPSDVGGSGNDHIIGRCSWVPTATNLILGLDQSI